MLTMNRSFLVRTTNAEVRAVDRSFVVRKTNMEVRAMNRSFLVQTTNAEGRWPRDRKAAVVHMHKMTAQLEVYLFDSGTREQSDRLHTITPITV